MARHLILAAAILAVAGCAADEPELLEADVDRAIADATSDLPLEGLRCPSVAGLEPIDEGSFVEIACAAELGGDVVALSVVLIRSSSTAIDTTVIVETPILDLAAVEEAATARLDAELGGAPIVTCAERAVVIAAGREVDCRVTAEGGTAGPVDRELVIRLVDDEGAWEVDLTP